VISWAQKPNEINVKSQIKKVKLFLTAGEMTHSTEVKLLKGRNKLVFSGISAFADPQSIQFSANQNYKLVSVSTEMDFMAAEQFNPKISKLKDSLDLLKDNHQLNIDINNSYQAELAVLNTNRDLKGNTQNLTVAQIKEAAEFYRNRTLEINRQITKLNKEKNVLNNQIELLRFQLTELNFNENQRSNQVIVLVDCDASVNANCNLSYLVSDCGWAATYDLAATDLNQKINLKYKARIYNNTGNAWDNVDLILSTADPKLSASQPNLQPWYLDFYNLGVQSKSSGGKGYYAPQAYEETFRQQAENNLNIANQRVFDNYILGKDDEQSNNEQLGWKMDGLTRLNERKVQKPVVAMKQIEISELTTEFIIENKFSCPTDGKPYSVDVKEMNLDATFTHVTIPKLDNGAFLIANIVGWQDLDLIPGPTNVYFGGVYVGVSQVDTRNVSDTLSLSFGRDNKVVVMRKLKQELSSKKVVGSSKRETYLYEIAVRNNRNVPIKIVVYDQIPISKNESVSVVTEQTSNAKKDVETGELKWELTIQPTETKSVELGYSVKYPKDAMVTLQRWRTISAPSF
jgi:predicted lactoylglutathione lyase